MSGSDDREEVRREHIRWEQQREARKADEDYDARHRVVAAGFLELAEADRTVRQARKRADSGVSQVV